MIRNLLATTALATLISTAAFAQDTTAPAPAAPATTTDRAAPVVLSDGHLASNIIGENVYNGTAQDAVNIGDVNDIVINKDGKVSAVVVGVGGFLGIGEKNVAVDYAKLNWADRDGDSWLVAPMTKEELQAQPAFDRSIYAPAPVAMNAPASGTSGTDSTMAPSTAENAPATTGTEPAMTAPDATSTAAVDRTTLTKVPMAEIGTTKLVGTTVYGANDVNLGEIGEVVLGTDNKVDAYIVDVGGFLGLGGKPVAVGGNDLAFMQDKDGNRYLYTTFTKEQLEAQPTYDKSTYVQQRDQQRMTVTE